MNYWRQKSAPVGVNFFCLFFIIIARDVITEKEESARFRVFFFVQFLPITQQHSPTDSKRALINLKNMTHHYIAGSSPTTNFIFKTK